MKRIPSLLLLLASVLGSASGLAQLTLEPCQLSAAGNLVFQDAHCATLQVAENPQQIAGRQIGLRIAVFKARSKAPQPDPIFFFAGGPGQSAIESFPSVLAALGEARKDRDIVLIDQRGTGQSNPLRCPLPEDLSQSLRTPSAEEMRDYILDCLQGLDADTRFYSTTHAAADVEAARKALGYQQINLLGISYGTRMAQVYLRNYPQAVRSLILDAVVPTDLILGTEHAIRLESTLLGIFDRCARETPCNEAFPGATEQFEALKQRIAAEPVPLRVTMPISGKQFALNFDRQVLTIAIRLLAYAPETQAMLPLLVHEAATEGHYQRLASLALMIVESLGEAIYSGLELSVMCAEDVPFFPGSAQYPETLMGDELMRVATQQCQLWPHATAPDNFHRPFESQTPVLILSGEYDPITPPEYGERALQQYPNGRHLVAAGQGHSVSARGCMPKLIAQFYAAGSVSDLQAECLEQLGSTAFFTTLLGTEP